MRILFVEPFELTLFCFRKELLDTLIAEGHEIYLCINSTERIQKEYSDKVRAIIDVKMDLKDKGLKSNLKLKKTYRNIIRSVSPDLILSFTIKPNIYCGFAAKSVPMIANITGLGTTFNKKGLLNKLSVFLYKQSFKNVDCVFFQNTNGHAVFEKNKIPVHDFRIIPGSGVNLEKFSIQPINFGNETVFLFASRAIKEKGFDLLVQSIPAVVENNPNVRFLFLVNPSDYSQNKELISIIEKYERFIEILPRTNDMTGLYRRCDFLVSPSYYHEGISNVLLESLATGRPIITTDDNPGCMEVLRDGQNGFGVKSNDLESLTAALIKASKTNKETIEKMGIAGRDFVSECFDRHIVVNDYLETIKKLTGEAK